MNQSLAIAMNYSLNDPRIHVSGLPGQHQGFNYTFRGSVLFIHIGKAGGGSVLHLLNKAHVASDQVHTRPVPYIAIASHARIVVCNRDPVDRLVSAYNWGLTKQQQWAKELHSCFDVNQFAVELLQRIRRRVAIRR